MLELKNKLKTIGPFNRAYSQRPLDGELTQADILFSEHDSMLFAMTGWS